MTIINKTAVVPYSSAQMFDLVNDIEKYPQFIPYCVDSKIILQKEDEIHAMLTFAGAGIHKSFTTLNRLQAHKMIEIRLIDGPFKSLEGFWSFEEINETSCKITLNLEFELIGVLKILFGPIFSQIVNLLVDSFHQRAQQIYL